MPEAHDALIAKLGELERAGDLQGGLRLLLTKALPQEALTTTAVALYRDGACALPYLIVQQLLEAKIDNWILRAISAHLGLRLDRPEATQSIDRLAAQLAGESAMARQSARNLLAPLLAGDAIAAHREGRADSLRQLGRLWAAIEPETMRHLAPPAPRREQLPLLDQAPAQGKLLEFSGPPGGAARFARKVLLAIRGHWIPENPHSREHEVPIQIAAAMEAYGWKPIRYDLRSFVDARTVTEDYRNIAALCREHEPDLVLLDEFQPARDGNRVPSEIISALKRERPDCRFLGLYLDPWLRDQWGEIEAAAGIIDGLWSPIPTALWQRPAFRGKALLVPLPYPECLPPQSPLRAELAFRGGVQYSNWYRAFWLAAIKDAGLPLRATTSTHQRETLSGLAGYRAYLREMATLGATLSFARRSDASKTLTGRTFEIPAVGGLLVQERMDDLDHYFVAGRHYLRFETLSDLADIVHLLRTEPETAEAIRRAGADFARARYADQKIISYLDNFAFHQIAGTAAAA